MSEGREGVHRGTPPRVRGWSHYCRGGANERGKGGRPQGDAPTGTGMEPLPPGGGE